MLPDRTSPADYGLPFSDLDPLGVLDPTTEQAASQYEANAVDCAAGTMTVWRAMARVDADATTPALLDHSAVWGETAGVAPVLTRDDVGEYRLTWLAGGYPDLNPTPARQVTRPINIRFAQSHLNTATPGYCNTTLIAANIIKVWVFDTVGNPADLDFFSYWS